MNEATSTPDPLLLAAAAGAFVVMGLLAVAAMVTPHVRAWWQWRAEGRQLVREVDRYRRERTAL